MTACQDAEGFGNIRNSKTVVSQLKINFVSAKNDLKNAEINDFIRNNFKPSKIQQEELGHGKVVAR